MRIATIRLGDTTAAVRIDSTEAVEVGARDVGELLREPEWRAVAATDGPRHPRASFEYAPLVLRPEKIIGVGLNYRSHIAEEGEHVRSCVRTRRAGRLPVGDLHAQSG